MKAVLAVLAALLLALSPSLARSACRCRPATTAGVSAHSCCKRAETARLGRAACCGAGATITDGAMPPRPQPSAAVAAFDPLPRPAAVAAVVRTLPVETRRSHHILGPPLRLRI